MTSAGRAAVALATVSTALIAAVFAEPTMEAYRVLYLHEGLLLCPGW
jgi:hypothetical protein